MMIVFTIMYIDKKTLLRWRYKFQSYKVCREHKELRISEKNGLGTFYTGTQKQFTQYFSYANSGKESIAGVAVRSRYNLITAALGKYKHADVTLYLAISNNDFTIIYENDYDQCGFITTHGRFVSRTEAKIIAKENDQLIEDHGKFKELISEELKNGYNKV